MTEKELSKLRRSDLLEMLLEQSKEVERLKAELADAKARLESRRIKINHAGSIAEAALAVSGIFETAQKAADEYLENLASLTERKEEIVSETEKRCKMKELACEERIQSMLDKTEKECAERKEQLEKQWVAKIRNVLQEVDNAEEE